MNHRHAVVWIDHDEAHVIGFGPDTHEGKVVRAHGHAHRREGAHGHGRHGDPAFFDEVARAVGDTAEVLVVGPASAKKEFVAHLERHAAGLHKRVLGVEAVDHPSERELLAFARRWFKPVDRMLGDQVA